MLTMTNYSTVIHNNNSLKITLSRNNGTHEGDKNRGVLNLVRMELFGGKTPNIQIVPVTSKYSAVHLIKDRVCHIQNEYTHTTSFA